MGGAGWTVVVVLVLAWIATRRDAIARVLFARIDARPMALFRIGFGLCLAALAWETAPLSDYLFSDEGLLPSAAVAEVRGVPGLGPDGVDDWPRYLASGRASLLHLFDPPWFARLYVIVLGVVALAIAVGVHTRAATIVAWVLLAGMLRRGDAHWGGEQVFTGLLFVAMFADMGATWSVDAWRRGTQDRDAVVRIAAWPQWLLLLQLALAYAANGWAKTGPTWIAGDTLALSMQLDRYARVDWQWLLVALGPWPLRLATWSVWWWERSFPVVLVGLWWRTSVALGVPSVGARLLRSPARWLVDARPWVGFGLLFHGVGLVLFEFGAFVGATVVAYALCFVALPWGERRVAPIPGDAVAVIPARVWPIVVALVGVAGTFAIANESPVWWYGVWSAIAVVTVVLARRRGMTRRTLAGLLVAHHACALVLWQSPGAPWRDAARAMVEPWMERTYTRQLWSMFGPNGPSRNQTVRTTVVVDDVAADLHTELEHDLGRPYLLHDRWRKVDEAVSGYRRPIAAWHARFVCRRWALDHGGEVPDRVVLERVVAPFAPLGTADPQAWFWANAKVEPIVEVACETERFGAPAPEILARHGLADTR